LIKKFSLIVIIALTAGCSNTDALENQINTLSNKVDNLTIKVSKLKAQQDKNTTTIEQLKMLNKKTNQRIDNVAASYKK
jgi:murein lipoprotein